VDLKVLWFNSLRWVSFHYISILSYGLFLRILPRSFCGRYMYRWKAISGEVAFGWLDQVCLLSLPPSTHYFCIDDRMHVCIKNNLS
jgi:hypothetical protein